MVTMGLCTIGRLQIIMGGFLFGLVVSTTAYAQFSGDSSLLGGKDNPFKKKDEQPTVQQQSDTKKQVPQRKKQVKKTPGKKQDKVSKSELESIILHLERLGQSLDLIKDRLEVLEEKVEYGPSQLDVGEISESKSVSESQQHHLDRIVQLEQQLAQLERAVAEGLDRSVVLDSVNELESQITEERLALKELEKEEDAEQGDPVQQLEKVTGKLEIQVDRLEKELELKSQTTSKEQEQSEQSDYGLHIMSGLSSAYVFRGLNLLQSETQQDQHAVFLMGLGYDIADTGLSVTYWGTYQINGDNRREMVDEGLGHEQDLILAWERKLHQKILFAAGLAYYFYPFADEDAAGTANPSWLEPSIGATYLGAIDVGLEFMYMAGLQEVLRDASYLYIRPHATKNFQFTNRFSTDIALSFGLKAFNESDGIADNMFDITFDWYWTYQPTSTVWFALGIHLAWTNLQDVEMVSDEPPFEPTKIWKNAGDEYVVWLSVDAGFDI